MTESQFIEENKSKWKELEQNLSLKSSDPDQLNALFKKVSGDLSYAQTYFPRRSVRRYLNSLVNTVFETMRTDRKINPWKSLMHFYNVTLPCEIIRNKNAFFTSLVVFLLAMAIGVFSTLKDNDFAYSILGYSYMDITEANIEKGDPMAIYKSKGNLNMFLGITLNNIQVAFLTFVLGFLASIGTVFVLIKNGVMVGVFQTLFYTKGLFMTSFLTIWIHGTIEISSIIVAGAAGLVIGNSILFPGTYTRMQSLLMGSLSGVFILLSTVPLFIIAGFFEGFVTRLTDLHVIIKALIILSSLALIAYIYVINPILYYRSGKFDSYKDPEIPFSESSPSSEKIGDIRSSFTLYRLYFESILFTLIIPALVALILPLYLLVSTMQIKLDKTAFLASPSLFKFTYGGWPMLILLIFASIYLFSFMHLLKSKSSVAISEVIKNCANHFLGFSIIAILFVVPIYFLDGYYIFLSLLLLPFSIGILSTEYLTENESNISSISRAFTTTYKLWGSVLGVNIGILAFMAILYSSINQLSDFFVSEIIGWHTLFENGVLEQIFIDALLKFIFLLTVMPYIYLLFTTKITSITNNMYSTDLIDRIKHFGQATPVNTQQ